LAAAAARTLPEVSPHTRRYVLLLGRRFAALDAAAAGGPFDGVALGLSARDRQAAGRALRRLEARWHDGDENLVRGLLDRWMPRDEPAPREVARRLLAAAAELARIDARAEAWWFFLWEMESLLPLVAGEGGC
jgi:hypothetical protein